MGTAEDGGKTGIASRKSWVALAFGVLVILAVIGGYIMGKDMALRDNARDQAQTDAQNIEKGQ